MRLVTCLMLFALVPATARAQWAYGPGPTYAFIEAPSHVEVRGQNYSANVSGMVRLCAQFPDLCQDPQTQHQLSSLRTRRTVAWSVFGGGFAAGFSMTVVGLLKLGEVDANGGHPYRTSGWVIGGIGMGLLLASSLVSTLVLPGREDVLDLANSINAHAADKPVHFQLGVGPRGAGAAVAVAW